MLSSQKMLPTGALPPQLRASSIKTGRQDYISVVLRLITMELYKMRRGSTAKIYMTVIMAFAIVIPVVSGILTLKQVNSPPSSFAQPLCSQSTNPGRCDPQVATQAELEQRKQAAVVESSQILVLPASLGVIGSIMTRLFVLIFIVLIGTIVGSEYTQGTIRLLFTRGPTRIQFLLAKIGLVLTCAIPIVLVPAIVYMALGYALHPLSGLALDTGFLTADWIGHALLYLLVIICQFIICGLAAVLLATWTRSNIAGAVVPLLWFLLLESLLGQALLSLAGVLQGTLSDIVKAIPDYLPGNNIQALLSKQTHALFGDPAPTISELHAWLVLLVYVVIFIALACRISARRDVTN